METEFMVPIKHQSGKIQHIAPEDAGQFIELVYARAPGLAAQCWHLVMTGNEIPQMSAAVQRKLGGKS